MRNVLARVRNAVLWLGVVTAGVLLGGFIGMAIQAIASSQAQPGIVTFTPEPVPSVFSPSPRPALPLAPVCTQCQWPSP